MQMLTAKKPIFFTASILVLASYYAYFRTPLTLNAYGADPAAWPYLVDVIFTLPLLYYFLFRPDRKKMLTVWLAIASFGMLAGRCLIPQQQQDFGHYAFLLIAAEIGLELLLAGPLIHQCRQQLRTSGYADAALERTFTNKFMLFEARIWYYALFLRQGKHLRFRGIQHFRYDQNHGNASSQQAWIMAILFEMPIAHLLLHLWLGNSWQAWTMDALNLWGLLYLIAEYRATRWRPISLDHDALIIRNGVLAPDRVVHYALIADISRCDDGIRRQRGVLRYRQCGQLNVCITLQTGSQMPDLTGRLRPVSRIYLSIDQPAALIDAVHARMATRSTKGSAPH